MNEQVVYNGIFLRRFLNRFQQITLHEVPICKYIYNQFLYYAMQRWPLAWAKKNLPDWADQVAQFNKSEIYSWIDEPYKYKPNPNGKILMRGGFGDLAATYLPADRFLLLSPNQAEVDLIKLNRPDLTAYNFEQYYRENPQAVETLNRQIAAVIAEQINDPIFGSQDLLQWFQGKIPGIVRALDAAQSFFESMEIGGVLTISSIVWMDSALNLIARAHRIPSLTLQHGLIFERDLFCHVPITATKKMVWGNAISDWYQQYGYPKSRISVIGSPRFDIIRNRQWCGKAKLCQTLGIAPDKKVMVYATGTDMNTIVPLIVNGLKSIPEVYLLVLLHPSESSLVGRYQELCKEFPNCKVARFGEIGLYDALSGADLFITHCSTAGLEAMLFNLPVITVEPAPPCFSYGDLGASLRITNSDELTQVVKRLISDPDFQAKSIQQYQGFLSRYCIPDGQAAQRLFSELEQICLTDGTA